MSGRQIYGSAAARVWALHSQKVPAQQIADIVSAEFGVRRKPQTIRNLIEYKTLRLARSARKQKLEEHLRAYFRRGLTSEGAARLLRDEMCHHLSADGVRRAWTRMGLRRSDRAYPTIHRGNLPVPAHASPLVKQFFIAANDRKQTMSDIARRAGVHRATIARWAEYGPQMANFEAALNVLGLELVIRDRAQP